MRWPMLIAVALAVHASTALADSAAAVRKAIEANGAAWSAGIAHKDAAAVADLYTADAIALPPNAPPASGRAAIEALVKRFLDAGVTAVDITTTSVEVHGDVAIEVGAYSVTVTPPGKEALKDTDQGKTLVVYKKVGGKWRLYRDMWSSNRPARPAPAETTAR